MNKIVTRHVPYPGVRVAQPVGQFALYGFRHPGLAIRVYIGQGTNRPTMQGPFACLTLC